MADLRRADAIPSASYDCFILTQTVHVIDDMRAALAPLEQSLAALPSELPEPPKAVLMISGHWEAGEVRVNGAPVPPPWKAGAA